MRFRNCIRACAIAACLAFLSLAAHAALPTYSAIYVFGDSYSDVGNASIATSGAYPGPLYYNGRFSNGPIWIEHVAGAMGLPMLPFLVPGGTNYAIGGAMVTQPASIAGFTVPDVPQQVGLYLAAHGNKADPKALYVISGGGNDIIQNLASGVTAQRLGFEIALGISEAELLLRRAGAKNFLISNLFDVGLVPAAQPNAAFATAASNAANQSLNSLLALEMLLQGIRIRRVDVFTLFQAVRTDPTHLGFTTSITTPCLIAAPTVCADPDHTLFWDALHPTEFGHSFIGVTVVNALNQ